MQIIQVCGFRSQVVVAAVSVLVPRTAIDLLSARDARILRVGGSVEVRALVSPTLRLARNHYRSHSIDTVASV